MYGMRALWLLLPLSLAGEDYPHHNFTFGAGGGQPRGELRGLFSGSPGIAIDYGYRFHRYFQAEIGLDTLFGAANVRDFIGSGFGALQMVQHRSTARLRRVRGENWMDVQSLQAGAQCSI